MGCRKQTKKAIRFLGTMITPRVMAAGRNIVAALDKVSEPLLAGEVKLAVAVEVVKNAAREEGREIRGSLARSLIDGLVAMTREKAIDLEDIGIDDSEIESMP